VVDMGALLSVKEVVAGYYEDVDILHGVNLELIEGTTTCIIGPNGAGKSTLVKTICGFLKPKVGSIVFNGEEIGGLKPHEVIRKGISYVPQEKGIFPHMTVEENLMLGGWVIRDDPGRLRECVEEVLDKFPNLKRKRKMRAGMLSGGEQKMLEVGRGLLLHPKLVIFDEPTAGLAPKLAIMVYDIIRGLKEEGLTILMVDQNVRQGVSVSDYTYIMEQGRITGGGPREEVMTSLKEIIRGWLGF